jgi:hypothetical protein
MARGGHCPQGQVADVECFAASEGAGGPAELRAGGGNDLGPEPG